MFPWREDPGTDKSQIVMDGYLDELKNWQRETAAPFIYDHLDELLPAWKFKRMQAGTSRDRWVSPLKADLSRPKTATREKTVVSFPDMRLREQGDWDNAASVIDILVREGGFAGIYQFYSWLSEKYGLDMPAPDRDKAAQVMRTRERRRALLQELRQYFVWKLSNDRGPKAAKVRSYLSRKRGFSQESIEALGFGFVPAWDYVIRYVVSRGYTRQELDSACQVCNEQGRTMVGGTHTLAIPYVCAGELKGFIFRRVDGSDAPKYIANSGLDRKSVFFNYPKGGSEVVAVVEGEMDALTATAAGVPGVVAMGGSEIAGERIRQVDHAIAAGTREFILCPDLDTMTLEDGTVVPNHAKRYASVLRTIHSIKSIDIAFDGIRVLEFPEPSDPDEYIRAHGAGAFIELMRQARPWWRYLADARP